MSSVSDDQPGDPDGLACIRARNFTEWLIIIWLGNYRLPQSFVGFRILMWYPDAMYVVEETFIAVKALCDNQSNLQGTSSHAVRSRCWPNQPSTAPLSVGLSIEFGFADQTTPLPGWTRLYVYFRCCQQPFDGGIWLRSYSRRHKKHHGCVLFSSVFDSFDVNFVFHVEDSAC